MVDRILIEDGGVFDGTWQMLDDRFMISREASCGEPDMDGLEYLCQCNNWSFRVIDENDIPFEPTYEDLRRTDGGMLNPRLVKEKKLTKAQIVSLVQLHHKKDEVLRKAFTQIQEIERDMQRTWGWEVDETKFTYCHRVPAPAILYPIEELLKDLEKDKTKGSTSS